MSALLEAREITEIERIKSELSTETDITKKKELSQKIIDLLLALRDHSERPTDIPIDLANIPNIDLQGANLQNANLQSANLRSANLRDANLENANLRSAILRDANLENANLRSANLQGARLMLANLFGADLQNADLQGAILQGAILRDAYLRGANLRDAYLRWANLQDANLQDARLHGANLQGTIFRGANLQGTILFGMNLQGVNLEGTNLVEVEGVAFEVHNKFDKFKPIENEYLTIINQPEFEGDIYEFIRNKFTENITTKLFPHDTDVKLNNFNKVFTKIKKTISNENKQLIAKSISFAFNQDDDFKQQYIINFLDETCNAYSGSGDNTSCVKGIIERFVLSVGNAAEIICSSGCKNETYKKLDKLMNPKIDIEHESASWWENEAIKDEVKNLTSKEEKKQHFINYLEKRATDLKALNENVKNKIKNKADEIDYAFENLTLGGKKKRKSRKAKKSKKSKKTKRRR